MPCKARALTIPAYSPLELNVSNGDGQTTCCHHPHRFSNDLAKKTKNKFLKKGGGVEWEVQVVI